MNALLWILLLRNDLGDARLLALMVEEQQRAYARQEQFVLFLESFLVIGVRLWQGVPVSGAPGQPTLDDIMWQVQEGQRTTLADWFLIDGLNAATRLVLELLRPAALDPKLYAQLLGGTSGPPASGPGALPGWHGAAPSGLRTALGMAAKVGLHI